MNSPVMQGLTLNTPSYVKNARLIAWVADMAALCKPDTVVWCDGSDEEYARLCNQLVEHKVPGCIGKLAPNLWVDQFKFNFVILSLTCVDFFHAFYSYCLLLQVGRSRAWR